MWISITTTRSTRFILLGLTLMGAFFATLSTLLLTDVFTALVVAGAWVCLLPIMIVIAAPRKFSIVQPITIVATLVLLGISIKTTYVALFDTPHVVEEVLLGRSTSILHLAILLTMLAYSSFALGYAITNKSVPLRRLRFFGPAIWCPRRIVFLSVLSAVVTVAATALVIVLFDVESLRDLAVKRYLIFEGSETGLGSLGYLQWIMRASEFMFYILLAFLITSNRRNRVSLSLLTVCLGIIGTTPSLMMNNRMNTLLVVINAMVLSALLSRRINMRWWALGVLSGTMLLFGMSYARTTVQTRNEVSGVDLMIESTIGGRHLGDIAKTAHIVDGVPSRMDHELGSTLFGWLTAPVPRAWWRDKPFVGTGKEIGRKIFERADRTGVPPGLLGELFLNFGAIGVPIGFFLFGILAKTAYNSFRPVLDKITGGVLFAILLFPVTYVTVNNEVTMTVVTLMTYGIPIVGLLWLTTRSPPRDDVDA